jgi:hypothetical protein
VFSKISVNDERQLEEESPVEVKFGNQWYPATVVRTSSLSVIFRLESKAIHPISNPFIAILLKNKPLVYEPGHVSEMARWSPNIRARAA